MGPLGRRRQPVRSAQSVRSLSAARPLAPMLILQSAAKVLTPFMAVFLRAAGGALLHLVTVAPRVLAQPAEVWAALLVLAVAADH